MHGVIFSLLQEFSDVRCGIISWPSFLDSIELGDQVYLASGSYPDSDAVRILAELATRRKETLSQTLESFGAFMVPGLIRVYGALLRPEWRTLDVIENTENMIHRVVRMKDSAASPPRLNAVRNSKNDLTLFYASDRKLCPLAIGIIKGFGAHYQEHVEIGEPSCMLRGDRICKLIVHRKRSSMTGRIPIPS